MSISELRAVHQFIISELTACVDSLDLKKVCCAVTAKGKRCTNVIKGDARVCKKHESAKLFPERKSFQLTVYHDHPPNTVSTTCPRCAASLNKTDCTLMLSPVA